MSYYDASRPWPAVGQAAWNDLDLDGQTLRSGASSTVPSQAPPPPPTSQPTEAGAFCHQLEEVDRAVDNLVKSGKMFGIPGRREWTSPPTGPSRKHPGFDGRQGHGISPRPHSMAEFGDARGAHQSNLQNFYASQRHQSSRGSNEAEQIMQAKRRMAAQRERELRNYHQEQQYNRTVLAELSSYGGAKPDRTLSPNSMSEADRRDLIARQRNALYGEGPFGEAGGYVDETGTPRPGLPGAVAAAATGLRGHSPLAYDYGRVPPAAAASAAGEGPGSQEAGAGSPSAGPNQSSRANSTASPQSDRDYKAPASAQQVSRTSTSSPGASPVNGKPATGASGTAVAPIGTRPSVSSGVSSGGGSSSTTTPVNPALAKRSTTPLASPLGFTASGSNSDNTPGSVAASSSNPSSATEGPIGVTGWGSRGSSVWGNGSKPGMGVQASVWG